MKLLFWLIVCGVFYFGMAALIPVSGRANGTRGSVEKSRQEVLDLEKNWLEIENDPGALEAILAPDFLHVIPAGIVTRNEQLSFMRQHPSPEQAFKHFEDMHVRVYGSGSDREWYRRRHRYSWHTQNSLYDVFAYREGKWQAVNARELPASETSR